MKKQIEELMEKYKSLADQQHEILLDLRICVDKMNDTNSTLQERIAAKTLIISTIIKQ